MESVQGSDFQHSIQFKSLGKWKSQKAHLVKKKRTSLQALRAVNGFTTSHIKSQRIKKSEIKREIN
jgi:hypothetical protein